MGHHNERYAVSEHQRELQMKRWIITALLILAFAPGAHAKEPVRLDATSDESAEETWREMFSSATPATRKKLQEAMLKINLEGVQSVKERINNPELQSLGIARIKDKIAGLSAEEIIEYGERVSTVKI